MGADNYDHGKPERYDGSSGGRGIDGLGNRTGGPRTYDPDKLDAVEGPASRFDRGTSPAGWATARGENTGAQWLRLADEAQRSAEGRQEETRRVELRRVAKVRDENRFVLVARGVVEGVPQLQNQHPRRIGKVEGCGGATIDSFLQRGDAWNKLRDSAIWDNLEAWANATVPTGPALRQCNDAVAIGILTRHGFAASASALTHGLVQQG